MITETYKISEGQFLSELEPFKSEGLPTNSIIHKVIPGCGATTLELIFSRNSIIIEPNKPVITGKCREMNTVNGKLLRKNKSILGVYEGVDEVDIIRYLEERQGFKKILTTPEGFTKVLRAIGSSIYEDYFLLFDECEKAIQDVDYRKDIINPINHFFYFKEKAFISATPIIPTDKRFSNFKLVKIEPDYDFRETITIASTNYVTCQLKKIIESYNPYEQGFERKFFVFFKSTNLIKQTIRGLKLDDCSAVYCSESSAKELRENHLQNVYDEIGENFELFNFLTSRFFSAVDINYTMYKCNPIIIMVSDVVAVGHTVIDPDTEAIQISGRFRRPKKELDIIVTKDIFHLTNFNRKLTGFSKEQVDAILSDKRELHNLISDFRPNSEIDYFNLFISEILSINGFQEFLINGNLNHFMVDNFVNSELVKTYYKDPMALFRKYKNCYGFRLSESSRFFKYPFGDVEISSIKDKTANMTINKSVTTLLNETIGESEIVEDLLLELEIMLSNYPKQSHILKQFGWKNAKRLNYDIDEMERRIAQRASLSGLMPMVKYIHRIFRVGETYSVKEIKMFLDVGIKETHSRHLKANTNLLKNGAILSKRTKKQINGQWVNAYKITGLLQTKQ